MSDTKAWTCSQCGAHGEAQTAQGARRALERHWFDVHRGEES